MEEEVNTTCLWKHIVGNSVVLGNLLKITKNSGEK